MSFVVYLIKVCYEGVNRVESMRTTINGGSFLSEKNYFLVGNFQFSRQKLFIRSTLEKEQ